MMTKDDLRHLVGMNTPKALIEAVKPYEYLVRVPEENVEAVRQALYESGPLTYVFHVLPLGYLAEFIDGIHAFV